MCNFRTWSSLWLRRSFNKCPFCINCCSLHNRCSSNEIRKTVRFTLYLIQCTIIFFLFPRVNITLGEYDITTHIDCDPVWNECADNRIEIPIDKTYPHPDYRQDLSNRPNDIALIRLKSPVAFNDFVKPICLPPVNIDDTIQKPKKLLAIAGWGKATPDAIYGSTMKLKAKIPLFPYENCSRIYKTKGINLNDKQICAGGFDAKDSCRGDSGGPLMFFEDSDQLNLRWYVAGIISFGYKICGTVGIPSIYTKVSSYMPWIQKIINQINL